MGTRYENTKNTEVHLTRFWGGTNKGVCLQLTKPNSFRAEPTQHTLPECIKFKAFLKCVYAELSTFKGITYNLQNEVNVNKEQLLNVINDLDLFIYDTVHEK